MLKRISLFLLLIAAIPALTSYKSADKRTKVLIHTEFGDIKIVLYDETPKHKENFLKLVNNHTLDSTLFHRVIQTFMIQGGDPESKKAVPGQFLGNGTLGYTIPAEIHPNLYHKRGVLAAARMPDDVNPNRESSACQFYITQGKKYSDAGLDSVQTMRLDMPVKQAIFNKIIDDPANAALRLSFVKAQMRFNQTRNADSLNHYTAIISPLVEAEFAKTPHRIISKEQREVYKTIGGTPQLDGAYTVFGEVISGMEVVDMIAAQKKDASDRPLKDVRMTIKVVKK